ncbi:MAG: aminodeoxychorismate synthase component I [Planctomycetes bacterium]|nr:aminodeoxychorismate synthase component I [Planctomycetota bacterium]
MKKINIDVLNLPFPAKAEPLVEAFSEMPYSCVLRSTLLTKRFSRYSFFCCQPFLILQSRGRNIRTLSIDKAGAGFNESKKKGNPFEALRNVLEYYSIRKPAPAPPVPFYAGGAGYFSYDLCRFIEKLPSSTPGDIKLPDMHFAFYKFIAAIDSECEKAFLFSVNATKKEIFLFSEFYKNALSRKITAAQCPDMPAPKSNFRKNDYLKAVKKAIQYINAGDIYQVNLSQRFHTALSCRPAELYRRVSLINPAPFSAFCNVNPGQFVISSSPERFLKVAEGHVETRPIKGTRRRSADPEEDSALKNELLDSVKDNAELAMIVDLERNDLGKVCVYDSVKVTEKKVLETYPTVHHLAATIEGSLHPRYDLIDLIKATFPGGSITGAPKIRAMEIIDELEPVKRSVYTGAIGYIGFDGDTDLSIAIRIMLADGNNVYYQAGGGIVADSVPEHEYEETLVKGLALKNALARNA